MIKKNCIRGLSAALFAVAFALFAPPPPVSAAPVAPAAQAAQAAQVAQANSAPAYIYRIRSFSENKTPESENIIALEVFTFGVGENLTGGYFSLRYDGGLFDLCDKTGDPITLQSPVEFAADNPAQPGPSPGGIITDNPSPAGNLGVKWAYGTPTDAPGERLLATCYLKLKGPPGDVSPERLGISRDQNFTAFFNGGKPCDDGAWFELDGGGRLALKTGEARAVLDYSAITGEIAVAVGPWEQEAEQGGGDNLTPSDSPALDSEAVSEANQAGINHAALPGETGAGLTRGEIIMICVAAGVFAVGAAACALVVLLQKRHKRKIKSPLPLLVNLFDYFSGGSLPNPNSPESSPKTIWRIGTPLPDESASLWAKRVSQK